MAVSIDELLLEHFSKRTRKEQVKIITAGRPRPPLQKHILGPDGLLKVFDDSMYDAEVWLSGCDKRNSLFCWTCVLFILEGNHWNARGFKDFKTLDEEIKTHKLTLNHLNGMVQFHLFLKQNSLLNCISSDKIQDNILVKSNSEALKRIIDIVCLMVEQASPPRGRNNVCSLLNPADCVNLLNLMKIYDDLDIADNAIKLVQDCPSVLANIVTVLANLVRQGIKKEASFSTCISLVLSEHSDVTTKSKLSTVVRYVKDGKISESFLGYTNLYEEKTNITIKKHVAKVLSEFDLSDKFLAVSNDGAFPLTKYMKRFLIWLQKHHPHTLYVPCYFHDFNFVLQQTVSEFEECELFFKNLRSIKDFFERNSRICRAFSDFTGADVPDLSVMKLTDSQFLRVLRIYRQKYIQFFKSLAEGTKEWSEDEIIKAISFQKVLEEYKTVFFLITFFEIFDRTAFLSEMLGSNYPDRTFETGVLDGVIKDLKNYRESGFEQLWTLATKEVIEDHKPDVLKSINEEETQQLYQTFLKVIDCIIQNILVRFSCAKKLNFISIFDCENRQKFVMSDYQWESLIDFHPFYFERSQLEIEMKLLNKYGWMLGKKSVIDIVEFFRRKNLHVTLKNLYKLAESIITLPCKPTHPTNSSEKFDSIKSWAPFSDSSIIDCLSLLCIEHDLLKYLKSKVQFYDEVILKLNDTLLPMFSSHAKAKT